MKGFVNQGKEFIVDKEHLETLILNYVFSNIKQSKHTKRYPSNGFAKITENKEGRFSIMLEYRIFNERNSKEFIENSSYEMVQVQLTYKNEYAKEECIKIGEEMYLNPNNVAFILKILDKDIKFI